jgi:hypothetical protein
VRHAALEQRIVASGGVLASAELRKRDRALAQALQSKIVQLAALGEHQGGIEPVALEPRSAADA